MALVLGEICRRNAADVPDKAAYVLLDVDGSREVVTYGELDERANRFASALHDRGVARGDRVAVLMLNNVAWPVVFFGALKLGALVVPVNARYRVDEATATLGACRPTVLVFEPEYDDFLPALRERVASIRTWVSVGKQLGAGDDHVRRPARGGPRHGARLPGRRGRPARHLLHERNHGRAQGRAPDPPGLPPADAPADHERAGHGKRRHRPVHVPVLPHVGLGERPALLARACDGRDRPAGRARAPGPGDRGRAGHPVLRDPRDVPGDVRVGGPRRPAICRRCAT